MYTKTGSLTASGAARVISQARDVRGHCINSFRFLLHTAG